MEENHIFEEKDERSISFEEKVWNIMQNYAEKLSSIDKNLDDVNKQIVEIYKQLQSIKNFIAPITIVAILLLIAMLLTGGMFI